MTQRIQANFLRIAALMLTIFFSSTSEGRAPDSAEFYAAASLGKDIASWIGNLKPKPKGVGIYNVFSNEPFDQDYSQQVEAEIVQGLHKYNFDHISSCSECRAPQIVLEGELLIVRKGMPDAETLKKVSERHPVDVFVTVDVYRTSFYVLANAIAYSVPDGQVVSSERFSAPAMSISTADVQFLVTGGIGKVITPSLDTYNLAANVMLVEEMGFAKGGLSIGTVLGGTAGTLIYTLPTIAFRGDFGNVNLTWSWNVGVGFGLLGSEKGITIRSGLEFFLGSFTVLGFDGTYFLSDTTGSSNLKTFVGLHAGFVLGR
jgi:hypothetical protein